ncbi:hypothetical protein EDB92DRAFT_1941314 [Lactarius akahatsu]|uniref:Uncharacterized protein n=1 Tax=Lactarius akahatsu TaxID=416441 RepID=A0AAD4LNH0_9AGAM|nr:hypothetical protein EDB92DRAFT_1941314 [Lactarius akahatsu]
MPQSSASNTTDSDASSGPKTNYAYTKPYGGMKGFMESHGLKLWNDDDVQEAKAILDGYREMDAAATETDKANSNYFGTQRPKDLSVVTLKHRMPKKSSASNTSASAASSGPKTNYELTKPYGGMQGFMHSYGLKMWDDDDVQEAKAILDGFREIDAAAAEEDKANSK